MIGFAKRDLFDKFFKIEFCSHLSATRIALNSDQIRADHLRHSDFQSQIYEVLRKYRYTRLFSLHKIQKHSIEVSPIYSGAIVIHLASVYTCTLATSRCVCYLHHDQHIHVILVLYQ